MIAVKPDNTGEKVIKILAGNRISGVPVVNHGKLVGIISRHDIARALAAKKEKFNLKGHRGGVVFSGITVCKEGRILPCRWRIRQGYIC
ncbi:MAG: hypothetical protein PWQ91_27 [Eubacteriales bacterium]|nr:hypothetical protein [Eubacteriales bacterium]MDN5362966.1 hypothetical protein [Eubacteriales bacterium]